MRSCFCANFPIDKKISESHSCGGSSSFFQRNQIRMVPKRKRAAKPQKVSHRSRGTEIEFPRDGLDCRTIDDGGGRRILIAFLIVARDDEWNIGPLRPKVWNMIESLQAVRGWANLVACVEPHSIERGLEAFALVRGQAVGCHGSSGNRWNRPDRTLAPNTFAELALLPGTHGSSGQRLAQYRAEAR